MDRRPPPRSSAGSLLLAFLVLFGSAVGVLIYQASQKDKGVVGDKTGFDVASVQQRPQETAGDGAGLPRAANESGLGMIRGTVPGMRFGQGQGQGQQGNPIQRAAASFRDIVKQSELAINTLAIRYSQQYPIVLQYGKEWMRYPDLRKLNDDYMLNHDPIAFMQGVAASPNFPKLIGKYGAQKPLHDFVMDGMKVVPPGAMGTALDYLNNDGTVKHLIDTVAQSLGLPAGLLASGAGNASKIDEKKVLDSMKGTTP